MGITVHTDAICDRCGETDRRQGAEGNYPPVGWAEVTISVRGQGEGWTHSETTKDVLCPKCTELIRDTLTLYP